MTLFIWITVWIITSRAGYLLMRAAWLHSWDFTRADRRVFTAIALFGPVSLGAGLFIWLGERPKSAKSEEVLIPKKAKR